MGHGNLGTYPHRTPDCNFIGSGVVRSEFRREDQTTWVLSHYSHIEMAPILLKRWSPLFEPKREQLGAGPIWVKLSGLPLHFWSKDVFMRIGNALGIYLDFDKSYESTGNKSMARILAYLDIIEGLEEHITLH